jgi:hypothetical protein
MVYYDVQRIPDFCMADFLKALEEKKPDMEVGNLFYLFKFAFVS